MSVSLQQNPTPDLINWNKRYATYETDNLFEARFIRPVAVAFFALALAFATITTEFAHIMTNTSFVLLSTATVTIACVAIYLIFSRTHPETLISKEHNFVAEILKRKLTIEEVREELEVFRKKTGSTLGLDENDVKSIFNHLIENGNAERFISTLEESKRSIEALRERVDFTFLDVNSDQN